MLNQWLWFLLALLSSRCWTSSGQGVQSGCVAEFQGRCSCGQSVYDGVKRFVTNCTTARFDQPGALRELPVESEVLIFTGNNLSTLPANAFGDLPAEYQKLVVIDLSNNNISRIQGKAFHHVPKIRKLVLNDNRWQVDEHTRRLFANLNELQELHLDRALDITFNESVYRLMEFFRENPMGAIQELHLEGNGIGPNLNMDMFCAVPTLQRLFLAGNRISRLFWSTNRTDCLPQLRYLDLSRNFLPYLTNDSLVHLEHLPSMKIDLTGNNFDCDCNMLDFHRWLHDTEVHVVDKEGYVCRDGYPEENAEMAILGLAEGDLQCQHLLVLVPSALGVVHVILILIVVVIVTLLTVVLFVNRRILSQNVRRIGEPLYRRMQYSTIQKQQAEKEMEL